MNQPSRPAPLCRRLRAATSSIARRSRPLVTCVILALSASASLAAQITVTCLNNTGDAALINSKITASKTGDEIVIVGPGLINQPIRLLGSRSYRGTSRTGTVLKQAAGANLVAMMASSSFLDNSPTTGAPLSVRQLTLDGNKANNTGTTHGLVIRSWLSVVDDIEARQMDGDGIRVTSLSANGTALTNTQVNGRVAACIVNDCGAHGISVVEASGDHACADTAIAGNIITNSGVDAIHVDNGGGWYIVDNEVYNSNRHGIYVDAAYATSICDNLVEGFGRSSTAGTYYGVGVTLQGTYGSVIARNEVRNINQAGNAASLHRYVVIEKVNYDTGYVSITDNIATHSIVTTGTSVGYYYNKGSGGSVVGLTVASQGNSATGVTIGKVTNSVTVDTGF